jgi:ABC-type multidrug transport system fused ATPase/permease subunit
MRIPIENRKTVILLTLAGIVISLYDVIFHSLFIFLHISFEWFEFILEELIQHLFHTSRQQSQLIVFYLLWAIALSAAYCLCRALPGLYRRLRENLLAAGSVHKTRASLYWQEQSALCKIKLITSCTAGFTCLVLLVFS